MTSTAAPAPPPAAERAFGAELPKAVRYAELLATAAVERGLIGPREVPRLWERHLLNCAVVQELIPVDTRVLDLGSGAGLPGIVLALARPDLALVLLEPLLRRTVFLAECVEELELRSVEVVRGRAEEWGTRPRVSVVTARAVAPLDRLARWSLPLLAPGGVMLALKGDSAADEVRESEAALRRAGAGEWAVVRVGAGVVDPLATVVRVVRGAAPARAKDASRRGGGPRRAPAGRRGR